MAVEQGRTRRDVVSFVGPLADCFTAAIPEITDYESKNWLAQSIRFEPNQGPKLEIVFTKENV